MIELTQDNFDKLVLAPEAGVVLVDYWSPICAPCLGMMPEVEAFARLNAGRAKFGKLDVTAHKRLSFAQKVRTIPSMALYKNGEKRFVFNKHELDPAAIQEKLDALLDG